MTKNVTKFLFIAFLCFSCGEEGNKSKGKNGKEKLAKVALSGESFTVGTDVSGLELTKEKQPYPESLEQYRPEQNFNVLFQKPEDYKFVHEVLEKQKPEPQKIEIQEPEPHKTEIQEPKVPTTSTAPCVDVCSNSPEPPIPPLVCGEKTPQDGWKTLQELLGDEIFNDFCEQGMTRDNWCRDWKGTKDVVVHHNTKHCETCRHSGERYGGIFCIALKSFLWGS